ncbi:hypothetical protein JSE7799_02416 [Jannaschia seosinensis]|uniref:Plant Basic Secretory Protein n=1 Tax=Jannaschia seosinensis TaxID=313367 RepID=A0A0M7BC91_9RHOB|nr:hypothetical protein [Jannaschia seosinensis]CUH39688.1 hypothetical protein JSE7799_02416 [Jannaschia seosinensis]
MTTSVTPGRALRYAKGFARGLLHQPLGHYLSDRVRIVQTPVVGLFPITHDARPRVTCRERIGPPQAGRVTARTAGIVLFERLFTSDEIARDDYVPDLPGGATDLPSAMFLVHEMTHVWQWQNRERTGYHPIRAFTEQVLLDDPYLFVDDSGRGFLDYGSEAQASLVEEYLCCATLDPEGARTGRLFDLLRQVMPVAEPQTFTRSAHVPWAEDLEDVCA